MIVRDTNVISELTRKAPDPLVAAWADSQPAERLFTTAVTEAEMRSDLQWMPEGRRKRELATAVEEAFGRVFASRVLAFDRRAAVAYGPIATTAQYSGRTIGMADLLIAAIAVSRGAEAVATRNVAHFNGLGVPVINPWTDT